MSIKDYIVIAKILGKVGQLFTDREWQQVVRMASDDLAVTNERFDKVKFIEYASTVRDSMRPA